MARLVAARCPTCGAGLRIDVAQEIVSCAYCNTSAFVKTRTRPVTQHVLHQHVPVIDTTNRSLLLPVWTALSVAGVVVAVGILLAARSLRPSPSPPSAEADELPARKRIGEALPYLPQPVEPARATSPRDTEQRVERPSPTSSLNVRMGALTVSGRLSTDVVQRIIRQNFGRFRMCYDDARVRAPQLEARVTLRFVIGRDGSVSNVSDGGSDVNVGSLVDCVKDAYRALSFPQPDGGIVTVVSPLFFRP
jgi:DNA-directed RNA polymerase subunit RPC12/RpoP